MQITQGQHWAEATVEGPRGPVKVIFVGREGDRWNARYFRKTRLYPGGVEERLPALAGQREALPAPKDRGEDQANDAAYDAYNRAYVKAARQEAQAVLEALVEAGVLAEVPGLSYSRRAGCSCPCSPGFVLKAVARLNGKPVDISLG